MENSRFIPSEVLFESVAVFSLLALSVFTFSNGLRNRFTFDDHLAIEGNFDNDPRQSFADLWVHDIWGKDLMEIDSHKSYRPILTTIFRQISVRVWHWSPEEKPLAFRVVSIALHAVCTLCVYLLARVVFGGQWEREEESDSPTMRTKEEVNEQRKRELSSAWESRSVALCAALIFAAHSVHVESVTAVVNLAEPLCASLMILAYLLFRSVVAPFFLSHRRAAPSSLLSWSFLFKTVLWTAIVAVCALVKETGIMSAVLVWSFLGVLITQRLFRTSQSSFPAPVTVSPTDNDKETSESTEKDTTGEVHTVEKEEKDIAAPSPSYFACFSATFLWIVISLFIVLAYFSMRRLLVSNERNRLLSDWRVAVRFLLEPERDGYLNASQLLRKAENPFAFLQGKSKAMSMLYLYFRYFLLLLYPIDQSPEYAFNCIPAIESLEDHRNGFSFALLFALFVLIGEGIRQLLSSKPSKTHLKGTALLESLMWMLVPFIPLTGIVFTLGTLLAERLLYAPSIGFSLCLALGLHSIVRFACRPFVYASRSSGEEKNNNRSKRDRWFSLPRSLLLVVSAVLSLCLSLRARQYNLVWRDDSSLFLHALSVCPHSAKAHLQVSKLFSQEKDFTQAAFHARRAREIDPDFCDVDLQEAYIAVGLTEDARESESESPELVDRYLDGVDQAVSLSLRSLHCVYTAKQALSLLHQLWDFQRSFSLSRSVEPLKAMLKTLSLQAKQALNGGLTLVAAQQFAEASVRAFELHLYESAVQLIDKAEVAIYKHWKEVQSGGVSELDQAAQLMHCRIDALSGTMRSTLAQSLLDVATQTKSDGEQQDAFQFMRQTTAQRLGKEKVSRKAVMRSLERAIQSVCIESALALPETSAAKTNALEHIKIAATHFAQWQNLSFQKQKAIAAQKKSKQKLNEKEQTKENQKVAKYVRSLMISLLSFAETVPSVPSSDDKSLSLSSPHRRLALSSESLPIRKQALQHSVTLGRDAYLNKDYLSASQHFARSLFLSLFSDDADLLLQAAAKTVKTTNGSLALRQQAALWKLVIDRNSSFVSLSAAEDQDLCSQLFLYADSMVGVTGFYDHPDHVEVVVRTLHLFKQYIGRLKSIPKTLPDKETAQLLIVKFETVLCNMRGGNCKPAQKTNEL